MNNKIKANGVVVMLKGVRFLLHFCWKFNKKCIAYEMIASLCKSLVPFIAIILPRLIIDELTGEQRIDILKLYVLLFAGGNFKGNSLTTFLWE
jgi:hypothetical protein